MALFASRLPPRAWLAISIVSAFGALSLSGVLLLFFFGRL